MNICSLYLKSRAENNSANRGRDQFAPFGSGCQQIGILDYKEAAAQKPRAVIGLTDITVCKLFDKDILSFTVPYKMYLEMEGYVEDSFLKGREWPDILSRNGQ
ncbi:MAG: DUF169 domain-containing protein [Selenomonadaceae bacterium]